MTAADGGAEALALLANGRPSPQLLLTDVVMRGMNGRQVAEAVKRVCPAIRVLFMSGYAQDIIVHHGVVEPGLDLLAKPFTNAVLLERACRVHWICDWRRGVDRERAPVTELSSRIEPAGSSGRQCQSTQPRSPAQHGKAVWP